MVQGMLLWINGPFGGGKTHTAHEIHRRLAGSVVCDPEHLGIGLRRMTPRPLRGNYQDIPAWRQGTRPDPLLLGIAAVLLMLAFTAIRNQAWFGIGGSLLAADTLARRSGGRGPEFGAGFRRALAGLLAALGQFLAKAGGSRITIWKRWPTSSYPLRRSNVLPSRNVTLVIEFSCWLRRAASTAAVPISMPSTCWQFPATVSAKPPW